MPGKTPAPAPNTVDQQPWTGGEQTFCYTTQEGLLRPMRHNPHHHLAARYVLEAQGAVEVLGIAGVEEPAQHLAEPLMSKDRLHKPIPEATPL